MEMSTVVFDVKSSSIENLKSEIANRAAGTAYSDSGLSKNSTGVSGSHYEPTPGTTVEDIHGNHFELLFHQIGIFMRNTGDLFQGFFRKINNSLLTAKLTNTQSVASLSETEKSNTR